MIPIKLYFTDFWDVFDKNDNFFVDILKKDFDVEVTPDDPDIIIYSWEGQEFRKFDCIRIYYTPENWLFPKYRDCDFSLSFEYWDDSRNLRMPNYLLYGINPGQLDKTKVNISSLIENKNGFCSMVVSNPHCEHRNKFFKQLSKYKKIDSGGKHFNNLGERVKDKDDFISKYKFNLCFENASHPGYTTEKIVQAMKCMTIPIYWGNPLIRFEFNTKSFFNYNDYDREEDLIDDIIEHDKDDDKYYKKFIQPWFEDNIPNQFFDNQRIRKFFSDIISQKGKMTPIARNKFKQNFYYPLGYQVNLCKGFLQKIIRH